MRKYLKRPKFWLVIALIGTDYIFFTSTDPNSVPSIVLIVGFILLTASAYWLFRTLMVMLGLFSEGFNRQSHRLAVCFTVVVGISAALQSIGQFSSRDSLILLLLAVILYIYLTFARTRPLRNK